MAPNFDMDVLRTFVAGADLGSFSRAAARVGRSQSAVSSQLRKLELQAGCPLVRKQGRGLVLTGAGEILLSYARRLLELNDEAVDAVRGERLDGWVRLGLPQDFAEGWLPSVLGRFARAHPAVRIEVVAGRNADLLPRIGRGTLDLALAWGEPEGAHAERLTDVPMAWIGGAATPCWRVGEPLPLVAFETPCRFRAAATAALDAAGMPWRLAFTSPGLSGLWAAVAAGLGITLRTTFGLPGGVRRMTPADASLPALPRIALSLSFAETRPAPAVAHLADILRGEMSGAPITT